MSMPPDPLDDTVAHQYQRWVYPEPIVDLPAWLEGNWQWFDPSHAHPMLWPDRDYAADMEILIAGCGANQAAVFAFTNPQARVTAIDVSQPSLDHQAWLRQKYSLGNLDLHLLPIEQAGALGREFDLIVSTGVLHHMADPGAGLTALGAVLRPHGVAALMLYAHYGRIGVEMLQAVFRDLGLQQDEASLEVVRRTIAELPPDHPVQPYLAIAPDLRFDAGLVDTFLHGRDRSYTVDDCLDLVRSAGLEFVDWFLKAPYYPLMAPGDPFAARVATLPAERQWAVMERVNARNACHFFTACRTDRPADTYRIDFASPGFVDYVPSLRYRCEVRGASIARSDWATPLDADQLALVQRMDGTRTIADIMDGTGASVQYARELFQSLWQLDFVAMGLQESR
jgi:SAM-dependent methyltransferase